MFGVVFIKLTRYTIWDQLCSLAFYLFFIFFGFCLIWAHFGLQALDEKIDQEGVTSEATIVEYYKERSGRHTYCRLRYKFEVET